MVGLKSTRKKRPLKGSDTLLSPSKWVLLDRALGEPRSAKTHRFMVVPKMQRFSVLQCYPQHSPHKQQVIFLSLEVELTRTRKK